MKQDEKASMRAHMRSIRTRRMRETIFCPPPEEPCAKCGAGGCAWQADRDEPGVWDCIICGNRAWLSGGKIVQNRRRSVCPWPMPA